MTNVSLGDSSPSPSLVQASGNTVVATKVVDAARLHFLPRVFGPGHMMLGETAVYRWMSELCPEYHGGFWDFIDLSNGGFYLRLVCAAPVHLVVDGNGFDAEMSNDAASIVASLFALNTLAWNGAEHLVDAYYLLKDFAMDHPQGQLILRAID